MIMNGIEEITKRAVELRKEKRLDEAESVLRDALRHDDKAWQLWNQLGHVLVTNGDFSEAINAFETATTLNPNGFWLWLSLGYTRKEIEQLDGAINATLKATELGTKPNEIGAALYNLGCYNCLAGRTVDALDYLDKAFEKDGSMREWAKEDSDLESLRTDKRFQKMMKSD